MTSRFRQTLVRVLGVQMVTCSGSYGSYSRITDAEPAPCIRSTGSLIVAWLAYVAIDGLRRSRQREGTGGLSPRQPQPPLVGGWSLGDGDAALRVTLIGTTGQGAVDGMRFVQFYFGLPLAMVILGVTLVPFLHGAKVYTAYEYLERRFDAKTRSLTAFLFLLSRHSPSARSSPHPAVVFSAMFGWPVSWSVAIMGVPAVLYTMFGGVQAVAWADVKQMVGDVILARRGHRRSHLRIPVERLSALRLAGATGRLQVFDFSFDLTKTYTFWSGIIGGTFLMLSYFGTDQSQVQRYLAAKIGR